MLNNDDGEEINSKSFRKYQLQRMRYYYAVIVCSDVATARNIYQNCDGTEYESTANFFDLRYVPSDMTFDDEPRDKCTRVPTNYKPSDFETAALQHSKVKLTWDETPAERKNVTLRAFNKKEMDNEELKAYLASDSESDEEGRADLKAKYQSLLEGTGINKGEDEDGEEDVDMEITFTPDWTSPRRVLLSPRRRVRKPRWRSTSERRRRDERPESKSGRNPRRPRRMRSMRRRPRSPRTRARRSGKRKRRRWSS